MGLVNTAPIYNHMEFKTSLQSIWFVQDTVQGSVKINIDNLDSVLALKNLLIVETSLVVQ